MSCPFLPTRPAASGRAITALCGVEDGACFLSVRLQRAAAGENPVLVDFEAEAVTSGVDDVLERADRYAVVPPTLRHQLMQELGGR